MSDQNDIALMREALALAHHAASENEVPVGAIAVLNNEIIGRGYNKPIGACDPSAHAEIQALRAAAIACSNYRLPKVTLVVTLEPCAMCAGAIIQSRVERLVFGAFDKKSGACGSVIDILSEPQLNHHTQVVGGLLEEESARLLQGFFRARRQAADKQLKTK